MMFPSFEPLEGSLHKSTLFTCIKRGNSEATTMKQTTHWLVPKYNVILYFVNTDFLLSLSQSLITCWSIQHRIPPFIEKHT